MDINTKILVCCHKKDVVVDSLPYFPIHVGKAKNNVDLGMIGDDTGDNISDKNGSYCELTGLYWAWRNLRGTDIVGLCHYRRYFDFHNQCSRVLPQQLFPTNDISKLDFSVPEGVVRKVAEGAVCVANPVIFPYSLQLDYCERHYSEDFRIMERIVKQKQPEKIKRAFYEVMLCENYMFPCNMFLMRWIDFDNYCSWLFPLLYDFEKATDISSYSTLQKRIYGFMAERLFNVWLRSNNKNIFHEPVIMLSDDADGLKKITPVRFRTKKLMWKLANMLVRKKTYDRWISES